MDNAKTVHAQNHVTNVQEQKLILKNMPPLNLNMQQAKNTMQHRAKNTKKMKANSSMPKTTKENGITSDKKPKSPTAKKSHGDKAHLKTNNTEGPLSANKKQAQKTTKTTSSLMQFLKKPSDDTAK